MIRILLADDRAEIRSALRLLLETRLEADLIIEARDMEHLLAQVEDAHPDLVILDWELPGRPTRQRVPILRALAPGLKILVINTRPEIQPQVLSEGADAFVCSTDPPLKLLGVLRNLIQGDNSRINNNKEFQSRKEM
jgi:DNA-binding NarL/FixJ family response regulator